MSPPVSPHLHTDTVIALSVSDSPPKSNFRGEGGTGVLESGECERRRLDPHFLRPHRVMLHTDCLQNATSFISFQVDSLLLVKGNRHSAGNVGLLHHILFRQVLEVLLP